MRNNKKGKNFKALSIVEMLVTMAIFAILSVMLLQSLFLNIRLSTQINIRARIRSEMDQLQTLIERDIRNADEIKIAECYDYYCKMKINGNYVRWQLHPTWVNGYPIFYIKRSEGPTEATMTYDYISTPIMYFDRVVPNYVGLDFTVLYSPGVGSERFVNVIVTIKGESNKTVVGCQQDVNLDGCKNGYTSPDIQWVDDQIRQFSVSTRNYLID